MGRHARDADRIGFGFGKSRARMLVDIANSRAGMSARKANPDI
jgi:hypothetical protein